MNVPLKKYSRTDMKCPICGKQMKKQKGEYRYTESGLDNVVLTGVTMYKCACGETMPELKNVEHIHRAIADVQTMQERSHKVCAGIVSDIKSIKPTESRASMKIDLMRDVECLIPA